MRGRPAQYLAGSHALRLERRDQPRLHRRIYGGDGRAHVECTGAHGTKRVCDEGRRVRQQIVGGRRRNQHHVELGGIQGGPLERVPRRVRGEIRQTLVVAEHAPRMNPGALEDPFFADADSLRDRGVDDDRRRQARADR